MLVQCTIRLPHEVERVTAFRHEVDRALLDDLGVSARDRADVGLLVSEVCANVMSHLARGDQYEISVLADALACVVEVHDAIAGRRRVADPSNALAESGRGLQVVAAVAATVQVYDDEDEEHPGLLHRVTIAFSKAAGVQADEDRAQ
jgi:anti-sigma regulatory factor (Ser/Thr protein kinase)